jgi:transcriptional regulator with XRE-family HTH domain
MARASAAASTPSSLGALINDVRTRAGVSIQALARKAKIAPILISRVESGVRANLEPATLVKIADALAIDVVPLLVASGVIPAGRQAPKWELSVDDRHALAERIIKLERRLERDRVELAEIRTALLRRPRD